VRYGRDASLMQREADAVSLQSWHGLLIKIAGSREARWLAIS
jgi:hypothetical protein